MVRTAKPVAPGGGGDGLVGGEAGWAGDVEVGPGAVADETLEEQAADGGGGAVVV